MAGNSLKTRLTNLADVLRKSIGNDNQLSLDDMYMILSTHSLSSMAGVNLINGSDPDRLYTNNINEYTLAFSSGGNGVGSLINLDPAKFKAKHGFKIVNNNYGSRDFNQRPVFYGRNTTYTASIWARSLGDCGQPYMRVWPLGGSSALVRYEFSPTEQWKRYSFFFNTSNWPESDLSAASFAFGSYNNFTAGIEFAQPMLEIGNKVSDWQPSPYDQLMGGVIKPNLIADWANNLTDSRVSLSDGILSFNKPNGGSSSADFYTINGIKLIPGHTYRLSYRVRGTGYVRTFIYSYNDKETGAYVDNSYSVQLEDSWKPVTYTFKYNPAVDNPSLLFSFRPGNGDQDTGASKGEAADFCLVDISQ